MKKVLVCIDGSELTKSVCDYGVHIAKKLGMPLVLLNVVEHSHLAKTQNLSGNLGFGTRDKLLEQYADEEVSESKAHISAGRAILNAMKEYIQKEGVDECETLLRHGTLQESLNDLSGEIKIAIIGLRGQEKHTIGSHVEALIRGMNVPVLLVNSDFAPIESILMAYDGSDFANKAIEVATHSPIFPNIKRHIVNVNKDEREANKLLLQAKNLFGKADYEVQTQSLSGDCVEALLTYQEQNNINIIAMGAFGSNRLKSILFGSFTTKMLLNAKKPLLLFR